MYMSLFGVMRYIMPNIETIKQIYYYLNMFLKFIIMYVTVNIIADKKKMYDTQMDLITPTWLYCAASESH